MEAFALSHMARPTMNKEIAVATTAMRINAPMPL
jgi:hypothetical protein